MRALSIYSDARNPNEAACLWRLGGGNTSHLHCNRGARSDMHSLWGAGHGSRGRHRGAYLWRVGHHNARHLPRRWRGKLCLPVLRCHPYAYFAGVRASIWAVGGRRVTYLYQAWLAGAGMHILRGQGDAAHPRNGATYLWAMGAAHPGYLYAGWHGHPHLHPVPNNRNAHSAGHRAYVQRVAANPCAHLPTGWRGSACLCLR